MEKLYAFVRILNAAMAYDREYSYFVLPALREKIAIGSVCAVPYGNSNKPRAGVVTGFADECDYPQIKPISEVLDYPITLNRELIGLCAFMAERFFCTFGAAARAILPAGQEMETETFYEKLPYDTSLLNEKGSFICDYLSAHGRVSEHKLREEFGGDITILLNSLTALGAVKPTTEINKKINEKKTFFYRLSSSDEGETAAENISSLKSEKQRKIVGFLKDGGALTPKEALGMFGAGAAVLSSLVKRGVLEKFEKRQERSYIQDMSKEPPGENGFSPLSSDQARAFGEIEKLMESGQPKAALLFGVTGSGKTRVIIEACKKAVESGKSAIVLVPEIGLTAQAVTAFWGEFGEKLVVIHSMLSVGERLDACRRAKKGNAVVIGTRSAVFAPVEDLGLIVIDEEQEHTYKSENTPKYHARDVARYRCAFNKCLMLLASATPAVESFYKAKSGLYSLIRLDSRYGDAILPECLVVDVRDDERVKEQKIISSKLKEVLKDTVQKGLQAILFINRRGYNTHLSCMKCGHVYTCPNCSVSLTYHAFGEDGGKKNKLVCHYCGYIKNKPALCEVCQSPNLGFGGYGTQRLESELEEEFPEIEAVRMDSDTTDVKHSHEEILSSFGEGRYNVLFGTQMVSKGLDFPKVALVGIVSADASLYMNDFRAGERAFSLFTQLAGRSGRGQSKGLALFQTSNPGNEILRLSVTQDYERFYESEISLRKAVLFPPFCDIAVFMFSGETESETNSAAEAMSGLIGRVHTEKYSSLPMVKLGPYREGIFKLKNKYRQNVIIKYRDKSSSRQFLSECLGLINTKIPKTVRVEIDINPPII